MFLLKTSLKVSLIILILFLCTACQKEPVVQISLPTVSTFPIQWITPTSASGGGWIMDDGGGKIKARGVCWSTSKYPTVSDNKTEEVSGDGGFISTLTGLIPGTTYYWVRAYATNEAGTAYGDQLGFSTPQLDPIVFNQDLTYDFIMDFYKNVYKTIQIGTQTWMAQNWCSSCLNDGTSIPVVGAQNDWNNLSGPGMCFYDFNGLYGGYYGALYNWEAVKSGKLCPAGWHVPSDSDWTILATFIGDESLAGLKLKETGRAHWILADFNVTNETGFTALPGAKIYGGYDYQSFSQLGTQGNWWSSTASEYPADIYCRVLSGYNQSFYRSSAYIKDGLSVRCIKD